MPGPVSPSSAPARSARASSPKANSSFGALLAEPATHDRRAFEAWWRQIPRLEGTLGDWQKSPSRHLDRGGRTHLGITERAFMGCAGAAGLPKTVQAFEAMTHAQAKKIAYAIWRTSGAHRIRDPAVATVVGDWFWGSNTRAWKGVRDVLTQLGLNPGPGPGLDEATLVAIDSLPPGSLVERLSAARRAQHAGLVAIDPSQAVFLEGWQARVNLMRQQAWSWLSEPEPTHRPRCASLRG